MPLYLTFALAFSGYSAVTAGRVILPLYALELGAQPTAVGLLFASYFAFPLLLTWPIGVLSDRVGSRWLLMFGIVSGAVGMLVPWYMRDLPSLFIAGTLLGLSFVFCNVLIQNLVGVLSKPHERARNFSNSSLVGSSTNVVGPLIAGFSIDHSGHAMACLYVVGLSVVAAGLLLIWGGVLPRGSGGHARPASTLRERLSDKAMLRIILTSSLAQVGQDLYQFYLPVYGHGIGLSASAIGTILACVFIASAFVRFLLVRLIAWTGEERLLAFSFALAGLGFALVPLFQSAVVLAVVSVVFGLGMGCAQPVTMMLLFARSPEGRSGETVGLRQTANNLARVGAPPLFGLIASATGLFPVFFISALLMGAGALITRPRGAT